MKKHDSKTINYFEMFIEAAQISDQAAQQVFDLMQNYTDVDAQTRQIHDTEHKGDDIYHTLYHHLNREFITPIEREDILTVARCIDDATDSIEDIAMRLYMLNVHEIRPEAMDLASVMMRSTKKMVDATKEFKHFKRSKDISRLIVELNTIEEEGDRLHREMVRNLFENEENIKEIIKWKEIFDAMEVAIDACEEVADVMEGVILKNS